jgi:hypothetical protein
MNEKLIVKLFIKLKFNIAISVDCNFTFIMSAAVDCKLYHIACARVKEYMKKFDFLRLLQKYDENKVVDMMSKYLKVLPENQQKFKLNAVRTFSTLTYFAWKGRKEYRDKHCPQSLPGYEHQIELLHGLYDKSRLVVKKLHSNSKVPTEDCKVGLITDAKFNIDVEEFEDVPDTKDDDVEIEEDIKRPIPTSVDDDDDDDDDEYINTMVRAACKESLCYLLMEHQILVSLSDDVRLMRCSESKKPNYSMSKRNKIVSLWFESVIKKVFTDNRRRRLLAKQFKFSNSVIILSTDVNFTYDDLCHIYTKIGEYRYQSTLALKVSHINVSFSDKKCLRRAFSVSKHSFVNFLCEDIQTECNRLRYIPKTLKDIYPQKSEKTIQMIMRLFNFDNESVERYLRGENIMVQISNDNDLDMLILYSEFKKSMPLSLQRLFEQLKVFITFTL